MTTTWRSDAPLHIVKLVVGRCLLAKMDSSGWTELGLLTNTTQQIEGHPRLLRSMYFGDDDYEGCVFGIVATILGEVPQPGDDPWAPEGTPAPRALTLHELLPNLDTVSDFIELPGWLQENDPKHYRRLFTAPDDDIDATLPDGTVLSAAEAAAARLEVGEMRRQVDRIRRDFADDPEAAVGQAKELIETACKTILGLTGDSPDNREDLPKLIAKTLSHLGLDAPKDSPAGPAGVEARAAKRVMGGVASVLNGAGELRNTRGTGHGRSGTPLVDAALARLTVSLVLPAVIYLIEVYELRTGEEVAAPVLVSQAQTTQSARQGSVVEHATFGVGTVVEASGVGRDLVLSVDFGAENGVKRLLVRYAPLTVLTH